MCMGGGGGGGGVITVPDTGAYDRQLDRRLQMMQMSRSAEMTGMQQQLQSSFRDQQDLIEDLRDLRKENAESAASVEAEARRMSNIIGAPPPEVSAQAPVIGKARKKNKTQSAPGKRGLRIGRKVPTTAGEAVGLNII